jgi:hypothetical protein
LHLHILTQEKEKLLDEAQQWKNTAESRKKSLVKLGSEVNELKDAFDSMEAGKDEVERELLDAEDERVKVLEELGRGEDI